MKKGNAKKRVTDKLFSESEQAFIREGCSVIPYSLTGLRTAAKQDIHNVLIGLAKHAKNQSDTDWLEGTNDLESMKTRVELALEYVVGDVDSSRELRGQIVSYEFGLGCVLELALMIGESINKGASEDAANLDASELKRRIHACQIALIVRGAVQQAFDLGRLAGAIKCFASEEDPYIKGHVKRAAGWRRQRDILKIVSASLSKSQIPSKKRIRLRMQKVGMNEAQFSRALAPMKIREFLPDEPGQDLSGKGSAFDVALKVDQSTPDVMGADFAKRSKELDGKIDSVATPDEQSIKPSGKKELVDRDIRRIKERLGAAYWLFLLQFGMSELEEPEDLEKFVQKLSDMGLGFK